MIAVPVFLGDREGCAATLARIGGFYTYVLRRPDGRPFYVGKGAGPRVLQHENEARHPNDRRSNAHKLNVIRSIWRAKKAVTYEIDAAFESEIEAYAREAALIDGLKRLHEGGPLTNRAAGGGSTSGPSPSSLAKHEATLGGIPENDADTATLNRFVLAIAPMGSVVLKPRSRFRPRPTLAHPSPRSPSLRQAVALAATAAANGIVLAGGARLPRRVVVDDVEGFVENGVSCDIAKSGLATISSATDPANEFFLLNEAQARAVLGFIGLTKAASLGIAP